MIDILTGTKLAISNGSLDNWTCSSPRYKIDVTLLYAEIEEETKTPIEMLDVILTLKNLSRYR
jgi:hypothetical protein